LLTFLQHRLGAHLPWLYADSTIWTAVGFAGTALFGSRFVIQWLHSERKGTLVVPPLFWHPSFWGRLVSLTYAMHLDKLPIILGQALLPLLHGRNRWLLRTRREPRTE